MLGIIEQIKTLYSSLVAKERQLNTQEVGISNREAVLDKRILEHEERVADLKKKQEEILEMSKSVNIIKAAKREQETLQRKFVELDARERSLEEKVLSAQKSISEKESILRDEQNLIDKQYKDLRAEQEALETKMGSYKQEVIQQVMNKA